MYMSYPHEQVRSLSLRSRTVELIKDQTLAPAEPIDLDSLSAFVVVKVPEGHRACMTNHTVLWQ